MKRTLILALLASSFVMTSLAVGAGPPETPMITEPSQDGQVLNPADVHMETSPFVDPDLGDTHFCTHWEIRTLSPSEVVWEATCATGLESIHAHFGDGSFVGSHAGRTELDPDTNFVLRARHRDDSGDPACEWSDWTERPFLTGPATEIFPLDLDDILETPTPTWTSETGAVDLPEAATPPRLVVESAASEAIIELIGQERLGNLHVDYAPLPDHVPSRVRVSAGDLATGLILPETDLTFTNDEDEEVVVYLPAMTVQAGSDALFWVSANGATYVAQPGQVSPDFSSLARGTPVPWEITQPGFRVDVVASGFQLPVNIAFVPNPGSNPGDPLYYVTELYGTIKVIRNNGTVGDYATDLIDFMRTGAFPGSGEQGLTGIVVEPGTGDVIAAMLYDGGGPHYPKVVRFTSSDGGQTAAAETILLDMVGESQGQSHQISNLSFGPDGKLYVHMGDGFSASTAQNLNSYRGKILRVNPDGSAPGDNPFYNATDGINATDYVYAYGVRNPFGGAWRSADGSLYEVENGPSVDRFVKVNPGQNYLWNGSDASMFNFAIYNWNPATGPTNIAFVQADLFGGSLFPTEKFDRAFIAESGPTWGTGPQSNGKRIREYELDLAGNLVAGPTDFLRYNGTGKATVVGLAAGPDGLYFTELYKDLDYTTPVDPGARVLRIRYVGAADFTADVTEGLSPLTVSFLDQSTVPSPTAWDWDFGDGTTSSEQSPTHTYDADGVYDVQLSVTGANGLAVTVKPGFIRVGDFPSVALLGGSFPPTHDDEHVAEHLESLGFDVTHFDDEPASRPSAAQLAVDFDLVVISSTILSSNVAGEFRDAAVPVVFWESALLSVDRMPLADSGLVVGGVVSILIEDDSHPIMATWPLGALGVYHFPGLMSVGLAPYGPEAEVLATRPFADTDATIVTAESGALLLGGHLAPARWVFLFLEDLGLTEGNGPGHELFDHAVFWALGGDDTFRRGDCSSDGQLNIGDAVCILAYLFQAGAVECLDALDANDDSAVDLADAVFTLGHLFNGGDGPLPPFPECGPDPTPDGLECANQGSCP